MNLYHCAAYGNGDDIRFHVRASADENAISEAKAEAKRLQRNSVFVEDEHGRQIYDGLNPSQG